MVQAEQEAAMRAAGAKFRERKKKDAMQNKGKLVGAALQAFARREERERVAAASAPTPQSEGGTPDEVVPDADDEDDITQSSSVPKRDIPTCKYACTRACSRSQYPAAAKLNLFLATDSSVEAPPSLRPAKKYCDVTGLIAPYTDPKSGLRYHSVEVYEIIKQFGPGVDNAYLSIRGDASQIM